MATEEQAPPPLPSETVRPGAEPQPADHAPEQPDAERLAAVDNPATEGEPALAEGDRVDADSTDAPPAPKHVAGTESPASEPVASDIDTNDPAAHPDAAPDAPGGEAVAGSASVPPVFEGETDLPTADPDATTVRPVAMADEPVPPAGAIDSEAAASSPADIAVAATDVADESAAEYRLYRSDSEPRLAATPTEAETSHPTQEEILAAERAERKAARDKALGNVPRSPEVELAPLPQVRTTDKFLGSLGLFLLRVIVAGIFGLRGIQHLTNLADTNSLIANTWLADYLDPAVFAIVLGAAELLIALALVLGLLVRVAGFGVTAISVLALAFVLWGATSPFVEKFGFTGEYELLLAGVGLLFMTLGGGGWAVDRSFRKSRQARKDERASV